MRYFCGWLAYPIVSILFSVLPVPALLNDIKSVLMWGGFFALWFGFFFPLSFFFA